MLEKVKLIFCFGIQLPKTVAFQKLQLVWNHFELQEMEYSGKNIEARMCILYRLQIVDLHQSLSECLESFVPLSVIMSVCNYCGVDLYQRRGFTNLQSFWWIWRRPVEEDREKQNRKRKVRWSTY